MKETLLQAILSEPDDDLHRLAYADYLLETGDEQERSLGEFIQTQITIAREEPDYFLSWNNTSRESRSALPLHRNAARLLHHAWGRTFIQLALSARTETEFRRGFPHTVTVYEEAWLSSAYAIVALAPVQRVSLIGKKPLNLIDRHAWLESNPGVWSGPQASQIHREIYKCIIGRFPERAGAATEEEAAHILSVACLRYAQKEISARNAFRADTTFNRHLANMTLPRTIQRVVHTTS